MISLSLLFIVWAKSDQTIFKLDHNKIVQFVEQLVSADCVEKVGC